MSEQEEKKDEELAEHEAPVEEETTTAEKGVVSQETTTEPEITTEEEAPAEAEAEPTEPEREAEEGEGEEEIEVVEEKVYTIPLRHAWVVTPRGKRAPRAVRDVRAYVSRHMKSEEVSISDEINSAVWSRGINKPPRKITVRAVKDKEGKVIVYPAKAA
jgi:large subunit ribosomal protein L31e